MNEYLLTPAATSDVFEIWAYIAGDNLVVADRVEAAIYHACHQLAKWPELGHWRKDLTDKPVRFFPVESTYLIVYDPATRPLQVVRVLHGARDIQQQLRSVP